MMMYGNHMQNHILIREHAKFQKNPVKDKWPSHIGSDGHTFYKIIKYWFYILGEADKNILIHKVM